MNTAKDRSIVRGQLLFDMRQVAQMLAMSESKLKELTIRGEIRSLKIDGMRRYHRRDIEEFAERMRDESG